MKRLMCSLGLAAAVLLLVPMTGQAQSLSDPCGQIYDGTTSGAISSGAQGRIRAHIEALEGVLPIEVHVHIAQSLRFNGRNYRDIHTYSDAVDAHCGWEVSGGGVRDSIVMYMIVLDAQEWYIYNGRAMEPYMTVMHGRQIYRDHLIHGVMRPKLSQGDFSGAVYDALGATLTHVRANAPTSTASTTTTTTTTSRPPVTTRPPAQPREPMNWTPVLMIFFVIGLGICAFFFFQSMEKKKRRRALAKEHRDAALAVRSRCSEIVTSFDDVQKGVAEARINHAASLLGVQGSARLRDRHNEIWENVSKLRGEFTNQSRSVPEANDDDPNVWSRIEATFKGLESRLLKVQEDVSGWKSHVEDEIRDAEAAFKRPEEMATLIESCSARIAAVRDQGLNVDFVDNGIETALSKLELALTAAEEKRLEDTKQICDEIEGLATSAAEAAEALPQKRDSLRDRYTQLGKNHEALKPLFDEAKRAHSVLEANHPEESWSSVAGNGTEASDRHEWAFVQLGEFDALIEEQNFSEAETVLNGVDEALTDAEELLRAIITQKDRAEQAKRELGNLFDEARRSAESARAFIKQNDEDIDEAPLLRRINDGLATLRDIEARSTGRVNYISLAAEVRRVISEIDSVFGEAKRQDDEMEALRRRHARERAETVSAISSVKQYLRSHRYDVGTKLDADVARAEGALRDGDACGDSYHDAIRIYQQGEDQAEAALSSARRMVRDAEDRREAERRAEQARLAAIAAAERRRRQQEAEERRRRERSYSSSSSWGSSGGGIKSSSFGSGFGGGGGGFKSGSSGKGW